MTQHAPLTPAQSASLRDLRDVNRRLRQELIDLNRQLDEQLTRRGQHVARPGNARANLEEEKLAGRNLKLRRANDELLAKLHQADGIVLQAELKNKVTALKLQAAELRAENQSLENVFANQMVQINVAAKAEEEMRSTRNEHNEEMRHLRDAAKHSREVREAEAAALRQLQKQQLRLEEKVRVQDQAGPSVASAEQIAVTLEEKERVIEALKYQVAVLSRSNTSDKRRSRVRTEKLGQQLAALRLEAQQLRERVAAVDLADELGVRE